MRAAGWLEPQTGEAVGHTRLPRHTPPVTVNAAPALAAGGEVVLVALRGGRNASNTTFVTNVGARELLLVESVTSTTVTFRSGCSAPAARPATANSRIGWSCSRGCRTTATSR